jgi:UDP:flavonoid glycosyltransferase YjiC (YdhE family)
MAHILTASSGLPSVVYQGVELARRLAAAGHRVTFAGAPADRALAEHHGLGFLPLEPGGYAAFLAADAAKSRFERLRRVSERRARATEACAAADFGRALRQLAPDLLLINGEMHEHVLAAWATGVPIAVLNSFVSIWRRPGLPPPHHFVRPGVDWTGTPIGMQVLWLALRLRKYGRAASDVIRRTGCDRRSILRRLARQVGADLRRETDASQWLIPFTYRRLPALSLHALEFEFPHVPPDHVRYVGPMVLESRPDRPMTEDARRRLEAIFNRRRAGDDRRLIYAAFGSTLSASVAFLRRLTAIVADRPAWELVLSLSDRLAPSDLGPLPARVHAFSWLPQTTVLRHADVMVTHGGISTIDECVLARVPVLVYCGFETDMGGTTARVVHHGIGLAGGRQDDANAITTHVDRLLQEERFRASLEDLRRRYVAYAAQHVAEHAVDVLLRGGGPRAWAQLPETPR